MTQYSVSYYVQSERYWQFAGQWGKKSDAQGRAQFLRDNGCDKVRIRKVR